MLKWMVTKPGSSPSHVDKVVTDDPLATLNHRQDKREPIYAVSRVNPIFEEDDAKEIISVETPKEETEILRGQKALPGDLPDSPPMDRESVRSSGYGSKEADSVSFKSDAPEDEEFHERPGQDDSKESEESNGSHKFGSPGTVAELRRSFENLSSKSRPIYQPTDLEIENPNQPSTEIISKNPIYVKSIEVGPVNKSSAPLEVILEVSHESDAGESPASKKSSWPRVSNLAQALQRQDDLVHNMRERERLKHPPTETMGTHRPQVLRFNPYVSVVAQNRKYVTGISISPNSKPQEWPDSRAIPSSRHVESIGNFQLGPTHVRVPSSLNIKDDKYFDHEYPLLSLQPDSLVNEETLRMMHYSNYQNHPRKDEESNTVHVISQGDMPNFGRAVYSNFYGSVQSGSSASQESLNSQKGRSTLNRDSAKRRGVNAVKDLWEKTGLKTNGRKLLVDVSDMVNEDKALPLTRRTSYGSTIEDDYRTLPSTSTNSSSFFRKKNELIRTVSGSTSSDPYEPICILPQGLSSITHSYEDVSDHFRGIDNLGFTDDRGHSRGSAASSIHSRNSGGHHQFQHNLTEFQRRVSERIQGEPNHRKSWIDVENGTHPGNVQNQSSIKESSRAYVKKGSRKYPGKAVMELGLGGDFQRDRGGFVFKPNGSSWTMNENLPNSFGKKNRQQIWDQFYGRHGDGTLSGAYFYPHPNSEAHMFENFGGFCHDFTIDPRKSLRMLQRSTKQTRRRRCCLVGLVLLAFLAFVGAIVGLSLFSTRGQRVFGPM